jgi:hypothetical protein
MPPPPARDLPRIWFLLPFAYLPLPAWALGLGIAVAITAAYVAMELLYQHFGAAPGEGKTFWTRGDLGLLIPGALLVGYIPTAVCYGSLAGDRSSREIRPLIRHSDAELDAITASQPGITTRGFRLAGVCGALIWNALLYYAAGVPLTTLFRVTRWDHHEVFGYVVNLVIFTMIAQVAYALFRDAVQRRRIGDRVVLEIDLLDLRPLAPLVRQGMTGAALWVVGISIGSMALLAEVPDGERLVVMQLGTLVFAFAAAAMALVLPARDVHRLIAREKQAELNRVHAAIRGDRGALAGSGIADQAEKLSLADLVAYRELIESVREWPFGRRAFLRLFPFLAIPIGGWIGGALVERLVESLLD